MDKKTVKKLTLHRETLRSLTEASLQEVLGGVPNTQNKSCILSCPTFC